MDATFIYEGHEIEIIAEDTEILMYIDGNVQDRISMEGAEKSELDGCILRRDGAQAEIVARIAQVEVLSHQTGKVRLYVDDELVDVRKML